MEPDFWHERWARAETGFHQQEINTHLQQCWNALQLRAGQRIFVPLCGKSCDLLWLAGEGHSVIGVELSPIAVEAFFAENDLQPRHWREGAFEIWGADPIQILLGDFFALEPRHLADCTGFYDRAALIALPPAMRSQYVNHLQTIVPVGAPGLLITMEYDPAAMSGPPFVVSEEEVRTLYALTHDVELLHTHDVFSQESRWRERGLSGLLEKVYRLTYRPSGCR
jgi:thiopurine S-methyltransferase